MKRQMTAMMTGALLLISATTLPAFAKESPTNTQPSVGGQHQTKVVAKTGTQMDRQKWLIAIEKDVSAWLTPSERATLRKFNAGIEQGLSPIQSAKKVGSTKITRLNSSNWYQIDLSLSNKKYATFQVNNRSEIVRLKFCDR
jgi:hypothetical protein